MPAIFGNWTFKYRIKLQRWRRSDRHWFRIVLTSRFRRLRGRPVLKLGFFYPNFMSYDESMERSKRCFINVKAVKKLLAFGVQPNESAAKLLHMAGLLPAAYPERIIDHRLPKKLSAEELEEYRKVDELHRAQAEVATLEIQKQAKLRLVGRKDGSSLDDLLTLAGKDFTPAKKMPAIGGTTDRPGSVFRVTQPAKALGCEAEADLISQWRVWRLQDKNRRGLVTPFEEDNNTSFFLTR
ncbi:hypothetical protein NDN08_003617 [Rhodosorus marinus]|uniref:Uncharacterized protein n=1 Tax=Rhodosorus marinus TaxID=101924 RepID=A0AAV8UY29_9RHOD|nr:hypothetical protein NDN08_003617 [Rhodosorus marinus]